MTPAPLGKRIGAFILDMIVFIAVIWLFGHLMLALGDRTGDLTLKLGVTLLPALTVLAFWLTGNTLGKRFTGLYIVDQETGETPTLVQYLLRSILFTLVVPLNIIFVIPVLVTRERRAFHDMIAGTIVVEG